MTILVFKKTWHSWVFWPSCWMHAIKGKGVCTLAYSMSQNFSLSGLVASRPEVGGGASRQSTVFRLSQNTVITILADSPKKKTLLRATPRIVAGQRAENRRDHELCMHSFTLRVVLKINSWLPLFLSFSSINKRIVKLGFEMPHPFGALTGQRG